MDISLEERARLGRNYYYRERYKNPETKQKHKEAQMKSWARYYDEVMKPALDEKIKSAKE